VAAKERNSSTTLNDVARLAGVSLATASRSLNGSDRKVKDELRQRVISAATQLNYTTNLSAQAMKTGTSTAVGLIVGDILDPYFSAIAASAARSAKAAGLTVTMAVTEGDATRELRAIRELRMQRPRVILSAGSLTAPARLREEITAELEAYERAGGRVILIRRADLPFTTLAIDDFGGGRQLAVELVSLGYRRFRILQGPDSGRASRDRCEGFIDGLRGSGIPLPEGAVLETAFTRDGGYDGARRLIDAGIDSGELVFATNDVMAIGAMTALREAGRIVGQDVAVAGFDDIPTLTEVTPGLTTVDVSLTELGSRAMDEALSGGSAGKVIPIPARVVLRESTPRRSDDSQSLGT
jgi:LacI family transcriptional regulator